MISGILSPLRALAQPIRLAAVVSVVSFSVAAVAQDAAAVNPPQDRPATRNFLDEFQQSLMPAPDLKT